MAYPRFRRANAHKYAQYTGGNISLTSTTAPTPVVADGSLDITLKAQAGDWIEYGVSGLMSNQAQLVTFDVYTYASGTDTYMRSFGAGLSATASGAWGNPGWYIPTTAAILPIAGSIIQTMESGDIDPTTGRVTLRFAYAKANTTGRTIYGVANQPLTVWAINLGPAEDIT